MRFLLLRSMSFKLSLMNAEKYMLRRSRSMQKHKGKEYTMIPECEDLTFA